MKIKEQMKTLQVGDIMRPTAFLPLSEAIKKSLPMLDTQHPLRIARVEQLRKLYETRVALEISPFDDGSADLDNFLAPWEE